MQPDMQGTIKYIKKSSIALVQAGTKVKLSTHSSWAITYDHSKGHI